MKERIASFIRIGIIVLMFTMVGCATHTHVIGNGGTESTMVEKRQWYVLWGLVPINEVSSAEMAAGARDYTIVTEASLIDGLISAVLGIVTVQTRTVTVMR